MQIQNLLNSIKAGIDPNLVVNEVNNLKIKKEDLELQKHNILISMDNKPKVYREDIAKYFYNFQKLLASSNINEKKN